MEKIELRKKLSEKRNQIPKEQRHERSKKIQFALESHTLFKDAKNILIYFSHGSEVETLSILEGNIESKNLFVPKLIDHERFVALPLVDLHSMSKNEFNIPEPKDGEPRDEFDLIIVPGLAFDKKGQRLGMGKGYYDRFLENHKKIPRIALSFQEQILDMVPTKPYDENVDYIITEEQIIDCKANL